MQQSFIERYYWWIVAIIIGFLLIYSFLNLTTKPIPWKDEATAIEGAYNLTLFGKLNVYLSPGEFVQYPFFVIASGPPLTLPLALIFKIFGFGLFQARAYMLLWIIAFLITVAHIAKNLFSKKAGILAVLLMVTFTPFHLYGRTMVGELPGVLFLLLSIYYITYKNSSWIAGLFIGTAIAMRPSEFLVLAPAIVIFWILQKKSFSELIQIGIGAIPGVLSFILFEFPNPLKIETWKAAIALYQNPFGEKISLSNNIAASLSSSTIIYFLLFACIILTAYLIYWKKGSNTQIKQFVSLAGIFMALNVIYFLRSPGWFRYLFPTQIILLLLIVPAMAAIFSRIHFARVAYGIAFGLVILQLANFIWFPTIKSSNNIEIIKEYLIQRLNFGEKVFVINDTLLSALIEPSKKYNIFIFTGVPIQGKNQLANSSSTLPKIVIYRNYNDENQQFIEPYTNVIKTSYHEISNLGQAGYTILERN